MNTRRPSQRVAATGSAGRRSRVSALKPLVVALTAINACLFVSLYGSQGEGRTLFSAYVVRDTAYRLSDLYLLQKVATQVERDYVDKERIRPEVMFEAALDQIQRDIPEVLFRVALDRRELDITVDEAHRTVKLPRIESLQDVVTSLRSALEFVEQHLYSDMPMQEVEYAAINGFLSVLDPHSILLPPEMAREMDVQIQGEFGGLGITISLRGEERLLTIIATLPDTPAARAGLKPGDRILQIEDESTINMTLDEAVSKLRGAVHTPVTILVERQGWEQPRSLTIVRGTIRIHSVSSRMLDGHIGYVRIKSFQHNTANDLRRALDRLDTETVSGLRGLVLDLRGNPGGPLAQAIEVADTFVARGTIVSTVKGSDGEVEDEAARQRGTQPLYPLAVIVDAESASASEIVAGALKNLDRGVVVGDRTFGKGSVQNLYGYPNDAKLKLTMAKYLTPGRKSIQSLGIVPDIGLAPVYFDGTTSHLYTGLPVYRESDLDSHLEGDEEATETPTFVVRYFSEEAFGWGDGAASGEDSLEEPDDGAAGTLEATPDNPPLDDFQVQFAHDLLVAAGRPTRSETLAAASHFLDSVTAEQEGRIQAQFAEQGIDWSPAGSSVAASLRAGISFVPAEVTAGEKLEVHVSISNEGETPAFQVRAETESELAVLDAMEFLFGRVDPGETVSATRTVRPPVNLFSLAEPVRLKVYQDAEVPVVEVEHPVRVGARPRSRFAYSLVVVDDGSGLSRGNGDGRIQPGEDIDLLLILRNIGGAPAVKAFSKLSTRSGKYVRLRRGTVSFPEVGVGEWVAGRFSFSVKPGFRGRTIRAEIVSGDRTFLLTPPERVVLSVEAALPTVVEEAPGRVTGRGDGPLEFRECAGKGCSLFLVASAEAVLDVTGKLPGWLRVRVPVGADTASAWVASDTVRWVSDSRPISGTEEFKTLFRTVPPQVVSRLPDLEVSGDVQEIEIQGDVLDDTSIHAFYVFVNDHKQVFRVVDPAEWSRTPDGQVRWRFSQKVPLDEGSNVIEVWAQDAQQHEAMDVFQVYRCSECSGLVARSVFAASGARD